MQGELYTGVNIVPFVYFVQSKSNHYIKIGFTGTSPMQRFANLSTMSPEPLKLLGVMRAERWFESKLHEKFAHLRCHGEWFRPGPDLVQFIERKAMPWDDEIEALAIPPEEVPVYLGPAVEPKQLFVVDVYGTSVSGVRMLILLSDAAEFFGQKPQYMKATARKLGLTVLSTLSGSALDPVDYPHLEEYLSNRNGGGCGRV